MEQKGIIIILCVVIAVLIIGILMMGPLSKEDTNLSIADKKLSVGDSLVVVLADSSGNPIGDATVKIKLADDDGTLIEEDATTNSKGKAKLEMEEKGKYTVECSFDGDDKYSASSASDKISVKKATTKEVNDDKTSNYDSVSGLSSDGYSYYPEYGPEVDSVGCTREYAIANNWHYLPQTIDGKDAGVYAPYDSKNGCYHT